MSTTIQSLDDLHRALAQARVDTILANSLAAELNAELAAVHARFDDKIKGRMDSVKAITKAVEVYASKNRATLLKGKAKSLTVDGHEIGWRDNGGAVACVRGTKEKQVVARLLKAGGALRKYFIRQTPSLDKDAIKAKWATFSGKLKALGLRIKHEEAFFIELDISKTPEA